MKKIFLMIFLTLIYFLPISKVQGQMMRGFWKDGDRFLSQEVIEHTKKEEQEGKKIWEKLQAKKLTCNQLKDEDFEVLGEYFMGLKTGQSHAFMNQMMVNMMGEEGEKQAHINLGKKYSGCFDNKSFNFLKGGDFSMMRPWMMGNFGMMGGAFWGFFGIYWFLVSVLFLAILVLLVIYLWKKIKEKNHHHH